MRLDKERQEKLEPTRIEFAIHALSELGIDVHYEDSTKIKFDHKDHEVTLFPYSGWHTGKSINDGRGLKKLLNQLKENRG